MDAYWNCPKCGQGFSRGFGSLEKWSEFVLNKPKDCGLCRKGISINDYHPMGGK